MDINELIKSRRTVHEFEPHEISQEIFESALEMGIWAPNHKLTLPWGFYDFSRQQKNQIAQWHVESKDVSSENLRQIEWNKFGAIPRLVLILQKIEHDPNRHKEDYASVSCAIQNISLFLWQKGIGTKWSSGKMSKDPRVLEMADCQNHISVGFLMIGFPKVTPKPVERKLKLNNQLYTVSR